MRSYKRHSLQNEKLAHGTSNKALRLTLVWILAAVYDRALWYRSGQLGGFCWSLRAFNWLGSQNLSQRWVLWQPCQGGFHINIRGYIIRNRRIVIGVSGECDIIGSGGCSSSGISRNWGGAAAAVCCGGLWGKLIIMNTIKKRWKRELWLKLMMLEVTAGGTTPTVTVRGFCLWAWRSCRGQLQ